MKKTWARTIGGALLTVIGTRWALQGAGVFGTTGGMNGEPVWLLIGPVVALLGLSLLVGGIKQLRAGKQR
ncbi:hypothetical protein [Streptomyces sp. NPDC048590]|uniref:hypothetical protein n=1 Tax=Streptomyces sp. NPDC048590 TaxID=3365574 RepID=UPI003722A4BC